MVQDSQGLARLDIIQRVIAELEQAQGQGGHHDQAIKKPLKGNRRAFGIVH